MRATEISVADFRAKVAGHLARAQRKMPTKVPHDCFDPAVTPMMDELEALDEFLMAFGRNSTKGTAAEVIAAMEGWREWLRNQDKNASDETKRQHAWQLEKAIEIANDEESEVPEGKHLSISASGQWSDGSTDGRTPPSGYLNVSYAYVDAPVAAGTGG
jgi:hypothetical protein